MGNERSFCENKGYVEGVVTSKLEFSHEICGEKFFQFYIDTTRRSNIIDTLPVTVSERAPYYSYIMEGSAIAVTGTLRTYNEHIGVKRRLILSIFASDVNLIETADDRNELLLSGYVCKEPVYRITPLGRKITDILLAVNRAYGKSDYIPCILWGRNAEYAASFKIGTGLTCTGRMQSRIYKKDNEERTAYEISIETVQKLEE